MEYFFRIVAKNGSIQKSKVKLGETLVGRSHTAAIQLKEPDVSGRHFTLDFDGETLTMKNLSARGTLVNDKVINDSYTLKAGDIIYPSENLKCIIEDRKLNKVNDNEYLEHTRVDMQYDLEDFTPQHNGAPKCKIEENKEVKHEVEEDASNDTPAYADVNEARASEKVNKTSSDASKGFSSENAPGKSFNTKLTDETGEQTGEETGTGFNSNDSRNDSEVDFTPSDSQNDSSFDFTPSDSRNDSKFDFTPNDSQNDSGIDWCTHDGTKNETGDETNTGLGTRRDTRDGTHGGTEQDTENGTHSGASHGSHHTGGTHDFTPISNKPTHNTSMKTCVASPAEIEFMKKMKQAKRTRYRIMRILILVVLVASVYYVFYRKKAKATDECFWPTDEKNNPLMGEINLDNVPGSRAGGFSIVYPKTKDSKVEKIKDGIVIHSSLYSSQGNVPLTIYEECSYGTKHLLCSLEDDFMEWAAAKGQIQEEKWSFEGKSNINFYGAMSGIPTQSMGYTRMQKGNSIYGVATIMRFMDMRFIIRVEVPFGKQTRTRKVMMSTRFMEVSQEFVHYHWQGSDTKTEPCSNETLISMQQDVEGLCPTELLRYQRMLFSTLIDAYKTKNAMKLSRARETLRLLRNAQFSAYRRMSVRRINALIERNEGDLQNINAEARAIFADKYDKRYHEIRNGSWEE